MPGRKTPEWRPPTPDELARRACAGLGIDPAGANVIRGVLIVAIEDERQRCLDAALRCAIAGGASELVGDLEAALDTPACVDMARPPPAGPRSGAAAKRPNARMPDGDGHRY
jgi:hypothetical protein